MSKKSANEILTETTMKKSISTKFPGLTVEYWEEMLLASTGQSYIYSIKVNYHGNTRMVYTSTKSKNLQELFRYVRENARDAWHGNICIFSYAQTGFKNDFSKKMKDPMHHVAMKAFEAFNSSPEIILDKKAG
jgi:hypothetical protein